MLVWFSTKEEAHNLPACVYGQTYISYRVAPGWVLNPEESTTNSHDLLEISSSDPHQAAISKRMCVPLH